MPQILPRDVLASLSAALAALLLAFTPSPQSDLEPVLYLPALARGGPTLAGCPVFPANNIWNARVDHLPVHARSAAYVESIGSGGHLHPDFGTTWLGAPIGIPYNVVAGGQPKVSVSFYYPGESDAGPYPIPANPLIEGGPNADGDRHILIVEQGACRLYELFDAHFVGGQWQAGSGAIFDLTANALRPAGWTSADAAGLPILPGLVRYDEVAAGQIAHAIRFTASRTQSAYVWPARHEASSITDLNVPPMGTRFRLKAGYDISAYSPPVQVILLAMQRYGIILADNGSDWYITGTHDMRWDDDLLGELKDVPGSAFEAVDVSGLMVSPDSGEVKR